MDDKLRSFQSQKTAGISENEQENGREAPLAQSETARDMEKDSQSLLNNDDSAMRSSVNSNRRRLSISNVRRNSLANRSSFSDRGSLGRLSFIIGDEQDDFAEEIRLSGGKIINSAEDENECRL